MRSPQGRLRNTAALATVASWILWLNISPFYKRLENEKEALLDAVWNRIGANMKTFNDVLPRHWTS